MADVYFMGHDPNRLPLVKFRYGGRPSWAFLEQCEDGFALLCKPAVVYVSLIENGSVCKVRAIRFRKQENLNAWIATNLSGLRSEGYNVRYVD